MAEDGRNLGGQILAIADEIARYSASTGGASAMIRPCVAALESSSWPEVAWSFSGLNQGGCPVEFAFSSRDNALRYTTEVAGPEVETSARLVAACELVRSLQPEAAFSEQFARWSSMQSGAALRWGCWLGIRADAASHRLKLYIEVPQNLSTEPSLAQPLIPGSELLMIGYDLTGGRTEYYFRQPQMSASQADTFQSRMKEKEQGKGLLSAFADLCAMPIGAALHWVPFGYSLAYVPASREPQFTFGIRSRTLGRLDRTRRKFIAYEMSQKRDSCYQAFMGDVPESELPDHGMLSLTAHGDGVEMRVSVSAGALARLRSRVATISDGQ